MRYRLIATDLDGTLLDERRQVSPRVRRCLALLQEQGIFVVPSTARPPRSVLPVYEDLGLTGPVIAYNGAMVFQPGRPEPLLAHHMPRETALAVLESIQAAAPEISVGLELSDEWHVSYIDARLQRKLDTGEYGTPPAVSDLSAVLRTSGRGVSKLYCMPPYDVRAAIEAELVRREMLNQVSITASGKGFVEIMAAGVSKGAALRALAAILGVPREQILALGDEENDIPLLEAAGLGIAMGNATEQVKAVAGAVTGSHTQDGWAEAVERYVLAG